MPLSVPELVYVVVVLGVGGYALCRTLLFLHGARRARIRGVENRRRFEAVETGTPVADPRRMAVERGLESIDNYTTVLRRLLVPLITGITLLLAAVPLFAGASAATASMIGAVVAVVLGFAVRPFLENAVAGLVISTSHLIRIGDTVRIDELYGTVEDITATHTAVKLWDWRRYLVPNGRMLQSAFLNYSLFDSFQWAYVEFWVAPDADLDRVADLALRAAERSPHFSRHEDPVFWVIGIDKDAICCWVAAWADTPASAWQLTHDVRTELLRDLRREGIPLSLRRVRWSSEAAPPAAPSVAPAR